jgi:hypothetical protein
MKTKQYSIVFHTDECYMEAMALSDIHTYNDADAAEIELFWNSKHKRDSAVRLLKQHDIVVDTFDFN